MKRILLILCLLGLYLPGRTQQLLSGRVISAADGTPLPGASIHLKDTAGGVLTDTEGYFSLPVLGSEASLQVSFLGYVSRDLSVRLPREALLVISLEERSQGLQEVEVSTGYQKIPRERATGSFTQLDNSTLDQQVSTNVLSRLEAVASGVTVDRNGLEDQLLVRGISTINGPKAPLIVVDNFPYEGDLQNINPNDVANITILRDAAAASIWGARAGNGVIVITTKKARFNQPLSAELHANITVSDQPDLSYLRQMSAADFIDVEQFLFEQGYYDSQLNSSTNPVLSPVVELLAQKRNGTLSPAEADARIQALRQVDVRDDYNKHVYQRALRQQYALNLRSGSEKLAWHFSAGYDRNADQLDARYDRLNLRLDNTLRPTKNLTLTGGLAYTQSEHTSGKPGYGQIGLYGSHLFPYVQLADAEGNPLPLVKDYRQAFKDTAGTDRLLDWNYHPLTDYQHSVDTRDLQDLVANFGASYSLPLGFSADLKYQYQRQEVNRRNLYGEESYYARSLVNQFTQVDPETGAYTHAIPQGGILDRQSTLLALRNLRGQLNFERTWGKHALTMIAGGELRHAHTSGYTNRLYGYNPERLTYGSVDYLTPYTNYATGFEAYVPDMRDEEDKLNRFVSQFANAAYTFRDTYTVSASARRDASNLFGLHTNDRWNPLWSAGLSWDISKEPFYGAGFLPYLKLRSTYGYSGNTNPAFTAVSTIYHLGASPYTQTSYARFSTYANPSLSWETVGMWNLGLDFSTKGDRVSGSLEYYRKQAEDLFALYPVDYTTGVGDQVIRNVAAISGHGADLQLQTINLNGGFKWTSQLNFSLNKDEVSDYYLDSPLAYSLVSPGFLVTGVEGKPVYAMYSYKWAGLDPQTGDPQGYVNGEVSKDYFTIAFGEANLDDLVYHGSALPTLFGTLGNTFTWKGFSLSAAISWKLGYYFRANSISYPTLFSSWGGHSDFARRWQQPGDEQHTYVPSMTYPDDFARDTFYAGSEVLVQKGDHVRLQYLTASYDLEALRRRQQALKGMQLYVSLSNLGLLWRANDLGLDPDRHTLNALPEPLTVSVGFKANL